MIISIGIGLISLLHYSCEDLVDGITQSIEDTVNGEATPLREPDLPNCSKVVTCCDVLAERGFSETVVAACNDQFKPAANFVIDQYQTARTAIEENTEEQEETVESLQSRTQETVEPGCRCFLEETVGQVSSDAIDLLPIDCEVDTSTGNLDGGAMCSDATDALLGAASE
jgi:hypothetical protein